MNDTILYEIKCKGYIYDYESNNELFTSVEDLNKFDINGEIEVLEHPIRHIGLNYIHYHNIQIDIDTSIEKDRANCEDDYIIYTCNKGKVEAYKKIVKYNTIRYLYDMRKYYDNVIKDIKESLIKLER